MLVLRRQLHHPIRANHPCLVVKIHVLTFGWVLAHLSIVHVRRLGHLIITGRPLTIPRLLVLPRTRTADSTFAFYLRSPYIRWDDSRNCDTLTLFGRSLVLSQFESAWWLRSLSCCSRSLLLQVPHQVPWLVRATRFLVHSLRIVSDWRGCLGGVLVPWHSCRHQRTVLVVRLSHIVLPADVVRTGGGACIAESGAASHLRGCCHDIAVMVREASCAHLHVHGSSDWASSEWVQFAWAFLLNADTLLLGTGGEIVLANQSATLATLIFSWNRLERLGSVR